MASLEKFRQTELSAIQVVDRRIKRYQEQKLQNSSKAEKFDSMIALQQEIRQFHKDQLLLARPENSEDLAERKRIYNTYAKTIAQTVLDENPVFFHGVKNPIFIEPILASGRLGWDDGKIRSTTSPGSLDVTTKNNIETSLGFMGLNDSIFLPAGCMFVIAPKDEQEKVYARREDVGTQHTILLVDFRKNPERIVAIVSTNENQKYIKGLCQKYGISTDKVCTFDGFIERTQRENQKTSRLQNGSMTDICMAGHEKYEIRQQVVQVKQMGKLKR